MALTALFAETDNRFVTESTLTRQALRTPVLRRSFRKPYPAAVRGEGAYVWDADGNRYLDLSGSAAVNFIGHGVREISEAMIEQARQLEFVHTSQFTTPVAEEFAQELLDFAGEHFRGGAVYFTCGGSESVETALKLARQYQVEIGQAKRHQILSRNQSYHGSTLGALAVSGNRKRDAAGSPQRSFPILLSEDVPPTRGTLRDESTPEAAAPRVSAIMPYRARTASRIAS